MKDYRTARQILNEAIQEREALKKRCETRNEDFWKVLLEQQRQKVELLKELLINRE